MSPLTTNDVKHTINTQTINRGAEGPPSEEHPGALSGPQRQAPGLVQTLPSHLAMASTGLRPDTVPRTGRP